MTKKRLLIIALLTAMLSLPCTSIQILADSVDLQAGYEDPNDGNSGLQRFPMCIPCVDIEGHTLIFVTPCDDYTLQLLDEYGNVIYLLVLPVGTASLQLPSSLSGDYQIRLIEGYWYFYGWIHF